MAIMPILVSTALAVDIIGIHRSRGVTAQLLQYGSYYCGFCNRYLWLVLVLKSLQFRVYRFDNPNLQKLHWSDVIFFKGLGSSVKNYTLVAAIVSVLLCLLFVYWFSPNLIMLLCYLALSVIALFSVPLVYRLAGFTRRDESRWLKDREDREYNELSERLHNTRDQLASLGNKPGVKQAERLTDLVEDYHTVVETRFIGKKHMPLEYLGAARQVQKQAVQNLADVVTVSHSMLTIDKSRFDDNDKREGQTAHKHSELYDEQAARVQNLLDENEQLFDALTETAVEVANIDSFSRYERIDTLSRLVSLSQIASNSGK